MPILKNACESFDQKSCRWNKKCFGPLLHHVWLNWALTPWDMKKRYETHSWHMKHLSRIAVISRQASYCSSPIGGRDPKGVQTLQWHVTLGCQDDNLCGCQDYLFLQNGSMHIPFRIHEILKILIANNSLKCIFFSLGKVQCKLHWSLPSSELIGTFQPTSLQHLIESTVQLIKWRSVW